MKKKTKYLFEIVNELFVYAQRLPAPELTFLAETLGKMCVDAPFSVKDKVVDFLNSLLGH